jgi:hypothetical protein
MRDEIAHSRDSARGRPCGSPTRGLLRRRELRIDSLIYTGKESNMYEEAQRGLVAGWDEVRVMYRPRREDAWHRAAAPTAARSGWG